jgi:hypothetical protein
VTTFPLSASIITKARGESAFFEHGIGYPNAIEYMKNIGAKLDTVDDGAESWRTFEHAHRLSLACESERGCKPAESAAEDEDGALRGHISLRYRHVSSTLLPSRRRAFRRRGKLV